MYLNFTGEVGKDKRMMNGFPKAILFDMDDTILAYSQNSDSSWRLVCEQFVDKVDSIHPDTLIKAIKANSSAYWSDPERHRIGRLDLDKTREKIVADTLVQFGIDNPSLAHDMALAYAAHREEAIKPFPDAITTLQEFRKQGVLLGLLTNGNAVIQRRRIEKHALTSYFDYILIEGEFGIGKPDRRVYFQALDQLAVKPEETWMVGDNLEWEVAVPQRLGIFAIWYDFASVGLPESSTIHPDRIIRSLSELLSKDMCESL